MSKLGSTDPAILAINNPAPIPVPAIPAQQAHQLGSAPQQLGPNGKPVIPAIPMDTSGISGIGQTSTQLGSEGVIEFAQNVRKAVVDGYLAAGTIPKGTADKLLMSGMLKDLVDTEFAKKKADVDAKNGQAAALVAEVLASIPKRTPFIPPAGQVVDVAPKTVPSTIPTAPLVPGEAETEPAQMDIQTFMRDTNPAGSEPAAPKPKK